MKKKILSLLLMAAFIIPINVHAASLGISASSTSVTTGSSVRITVKANGLAGRFSVTSSNSGVLSGGTNSEWLENESKTYTFNAKSIGKATITVKAINAADSSSSAPFSGSKSITINVVKPREKSTNNNLKGLSVENYTLTPDFNKDTLEYTVEIGDNAEVIKINAEKEDGYASLEGDGEKEVAEGSNKFEVKVTSETGVEKIYVLNVNVKDNNPISKTVDGKSYNLVKRAKSLVLPDALDKELFTETKVTVDEVEIPAYTSETLGLTLIGLKDENGTVYLYKYENDKITTRYELLTSKGLTIEFKEPTEVLEGYTKTSLKIGEKEYTVYQNKYTNYALIYGTNIDTKEDNWYLYNIKENSIQTYMKDVIDDMNADFNKQIDQYKIVILALSGLSLLLLIVAVVAMLKKGNKKPKIQEIKKEDLKSLENTKELDKTEIIINKIETPKEEIKEEPKKKKKDKHKKKEEKKSSEFLNTKDLAEILYDTEVLEKIDTKPKKDEKVEVVEFEDEMDMEFFDDYKKRKKKKK